jgi:tRNA(fMet)-specific endonuclease VapC
MIVLDTDHLSVLRYPQSSRARPLLARLQAANDPEVATTIISAEEGIRGWMAAIARERQILRQSIAYRELGELLSFLTGWTLLPFDASAATEFELLRRSGARRVGAQDLKIASIARTRNALLLSANLRHFSQVPGLRVENWMT